MVEIILKENQTGYDAVCEYIERYFKHQFEDGYRNDVIVSLAASYNGKDFSQENQLVILDEALDLEFVDDWWEGEKFICIYGIQAIEDIPVSGGIYDN